MNVDWLGVLFAGAAAALLLAAIYTLRERKSEVFGLVAILFVVCVCVAYSRLFTIIPHVIQQMPVSVP